MSATVVRRVAALAATVLCVATAPAVAGGGPARAEEPGREKWHTEVLARVAAPGYPAHVVRHSNGRVYAGTFSNPQGDSLRSVVREWTRGGTLLRSWTVPGQDLVASHGVQVATEDARGRLVVLDKGSGRVLRLAPGSGRWTTYARVRDLPTCGGGAAGACTPNLIDEGPIPNYAAWGPDGSLYLTDYGQAVLWRVPPGGGRARPWFTSRLLDGLQFGTAGLALAPDHRSLYVMQQTSLGLGELSVAQGKLYRLPLEGEPALTKVWESGPLDLPDGFSFARSGHVYVACAGTNQIVELDQDFAQVARVPALPVAGENGSAIPFDTPSNVTFAGRSVLVANQSFLGSTAHHAILDVHVGERGVPVHIPEGAGIRP